MKTLSRSLLLLSLCSSAAYATTRFTAHGNSNETHRRWEVPAYAYREARDNMLQDAARQCPDGTLVEVGQRQYSNEYVADFDVYAHASSEFECR